MSTGSRTLFAVMIGFSIIASVNTAILLGSEILRGAPLAVQTPEDLAARTVTWPMILPESLLFPALGTAVYLLLQSFVPRRKDGIFIALVLIIATLMSIGPAFQGVDLQSKILLTLTHAVIALVLIFTIRRVLDEKQISRK